MTSKWNIHQKALPTAGHCTLFFCPGGKIEIPQAAVPGSGPPPPSLFLNLHPALFLRVGGPLNVGRSAILFLLRHVCVNGV